MSNNRFEFSRSLIGYKRKQVNKYIRRLIMKNDKEVSEIKESISIIAEKNEILQKKLEELKCRMDDGSKQQRIVEFGCKESKDEPAASIEPAVYGGTEIEDSQENEEIHGQSDHDFMPGDEDDSQKIDKEIEINNKDVEILESKTTDKMTVAKMDTSFGGKDSPTHKASSFWEYEFEELFTETAASEEDTGSMEIRFENQETDKNEEKQPEASLLKENMAENDTNIKKEEENNKLENEGLDNRIKDIRSKYLIDKIVGEDLMDRKGNLLAKKGSLITENLIQVAGREGKLAELIVNMILPDTSE